MVGFASAIDVPGKPATDDDDEWMKPVETTTAAHHRLLMDHLERVARRQIQRLMIFMPPGAGKSSYTSVVFPTWFLGWRPESRIILASYAMDIARKQGRRARQIVRLPKYKPIFGTELSDESSAANQWALTNGSEFMAGGLLGSITGNRSDGIIIDDPVAGREEAESETMRAKTLDAYWDDLRTRNKPGGWEILMQTRWHPKDLAGSILPEGWEITGKSGPIDCRDGNVWHVLNLPAIAERVDDPLGREKGDRLWPEWFTATHFDTFKANARTWASMFQQRPTDPEGGYYRREWFKTIHPDRVPRLRHVVRSWDLAATAASESDDPDWLAGVKVGAGEDGRYYIIHAHRSRVTPKVIESTIMQFGASDGRDCLIRIEQEGAASGKIVKYHYERMMNGWDCRFTAAPRSSKAVRAAPFNAACERGDVVIVEGDWNAAFIDELVSFPAGHDDQHDAATNGYTSLTDGGLVEIESGGYVITSSGVY